MFIKLPSGRIVRVDNVGNISHPRNVDNRLTVTAHIDGEVTQLYDADATALYKYMERLALAVDENGRSGA